MNDIVMLCESWTSECSDLNVEGYAEPFCKHRKRKKGAKTDSGGIVCYFRNEIVQGITEIEWNFEDGMCFKLDKHFFNMTDDVFLLCVYMRSNTSTREDINDGLNCYDILYEQVAKFSRQGGLIVVGDFNARSGVREECLIGGLDERDMSVANEFINPFYEYESENNRKICIEDVLANDMTIDRMNADSTVNDYGNRLVQLCMTCDMLIMNGRAGKDKGKGTWTFCNHRGESVIDYVICNKPVLNNFKNFHVHDVNCISDHCILSFQLCIDKFVPRNVDKSTHYCNNKWKEE